MPNWCTNTLTVTGDASTIDAMLGSVRDGETTLSFEKIDPTPDELLGQSVPVRDPEQRARNVAAHGHADWYTWRLAHWGTKWELDDETILDRCVDADGRDQVVLSFYTAWGPPVHAVSTLALRWPALVFVLSYDEPSMDFSGAVVWSEGSLTGRHEGPSVVAKQWADAENPSMASTGTDVAASAVSLPAHQANGRE